MLHPFRASVQLIGILFVLLACLWPGSVLAVASDWQTADFSQTRLITGERAEDGSLSAAVELQLEEGWKTYWRSPGDAGFPFVVEVQPEAQNVAGVDIIWPYPYRFVEEWGLEMFGYKQGLVLPLRIEPEDATQPMQLELLLNYAVCSDICINESQTVSLAIPVDAAADSAHVASIQKALAKVPNASGEAGLRIAEAEIAEEGEKNGVLVVTVARDDGSFAQPELFIESNKAGLRFPEGEVETGDGGMQATFRVPYEISVPAKTLEGVEITATLVSKGQAVERELQLTDVAAGLSELFDDIEALATRCKFRDCAHETEPGCAVQAAIADGALDPARLVRFRKLAAEETHNRETIAEKRAREKGFAKHVKRITKDKPNRR